MISGKIGFKNIHFSIQYTPHPSRGCFNQTFTSLYFYFIIFFLGGGWFFFDGVKQLNDIDNMNDDDDHNETNNWIDHSFTRPKNHSLDSIIVTSKRALV